LCCEVYLAVVVMSGWWRCGAYGQVGLKITCQVSPSSRPGTHILVHCCGADVEPSRPACPMPPQVFDTLDSLLDPFFFPTREGQPDPRVCPSCSARLVIKPARGQGAFIGCSNYSSEGDSSCGYSRPLLVVDGEQAGGRRQRDSGCCCWHTGLDLSQACPASHSLRRASARSQVTSRIPCSLSYASHAMQQHPKPLTPLYTLQLTSTMEAAGS
jgi:hypothetical protein